MDFDFLVGKGGAKEAVASEEKSDAVGVILISGTCCNPGLAAADERARHVIEEAASQAGVEVRIEAMTMTSAYYSAPRDVKRVLMGEFAGGGISMPAILIGGKAVSYGVPSMEAMKAALLDAAEAKKKEQKGE
jgi:hypothetical protein